MGLNKQKGNMYGFVTHTWNVVKGKCPHDCSYCYMKRFPLKEIRFDEKELKTDLGSGNYIFVGSSCDMFAEDIPLDWIMKIVAHCKKYPENKYLFQSKNPKRFWDITWSDYPDDSVFCTTVECDHTESFSKAPSAFHRCKWLQQIPRPFKKMITIEPIIDFNLTAMTNLIKLASPDYVNIGADSKHSGLPEPSEDKVKDLIKVLEGCSEITLKKNLKRITGEGHEIASDN